MHNNRTTYPDPHPRRTATRLSLCALATAAMLAACGGGGSDTKQASTTPVAQTPVAPPVNNYELQAAPAPSSADTWQNFALKYLNDHRTRCGFGALTQAPTLEKAAQAHSTYLTQLAKDIGGEAWATSLHLESADRPALFTGKWPWDRAATAGYTGQYVTEQIATGYSPAESPLSPEATKLMVLRSLQQLLSATYHMEEMISSTREISFGLAPWTHKSNPVYPWSMGFLVLNPGWQRWEQASLTSFSRSSMAPLKHLRRYLVTNTK